MQAIKDKLHEMSDMRKAKAEAKAEEQVHAFCFSFHKQLIN